MPKYKGKQLVVEITKNAVVTDISGSSRTFKYNGKAASIDVTTRDSNGKESLPDDAEYAWETTGLDTTGQPDWEEKFEVGDIVTVTWYPEGKAVGKRKRSAPATLEEVDFDSPHDGPATWKLGGKLTSKPAKTLQ